MKLVKFIVPSGHSIDVPNGRLFGNKIKGNKPRKLLIPRKNIFIEWLRILIADPDRESSDITIGRRRHFWDRLNGITHEQYTLAYRPAPSYMAKNCDEPVISDSIPLCKDCNQKQLEAIEAHVRREEIKRKQISILEESTKLTQRETESLDFTRPLLPSHTINRTSTPPSGNIPGISESQLSELIKRYMSAPKEDLERLPKDVLNPADFSRYLTYDVTKLMEEGITDDDKTEGSNTD